MLCQDEQTLDTHLSLLVSSAAAALAKEDALLRGYLDACTEAYGFYKDWPHGVTALYEQLLVYVIVRELLGTRFPFEIGWEHPYPGAPRTKADLFIKVNGQMRGCIESKVWFTEHATEIKSDLDKMAILPPDVRRFVLVFFWNETLQQIQDNVEWLRSTLGLRPFPRRRARSERRHCCTASPRTPLQPLPCLNTRYRATEPHAGRLIAPHARHRCVQAARASVA